MNENITKERLFLSIDASNIHYAVKREGWRINWERFINYIRTDYNFFGVYFYCGIISQSVYITKYPESTRHDFLSAKRKKTLFFKSLRRFGYSVRQKPVTQVYDNDLGQYKRKCNFDVEITIDAIRFIDQYDTFILMSGDGDFIKLVKYLKGQMKRVTVISHIRHSNDNLIKTANRFIPLRSIKEHIKEIAENSI